MLSIMVSLQHPYGMVQQSAQPQLRMPLAAGAAAAASSTHYRGFLDALRTIAREEGLLGFYRGLAPSLLLISHGSINLMVYEELKLAVKEWRASNGHNGGPLAQDYVVAGLGAKIAAQLVTYPLQVWLGCFVFSW